MKENINFEEIMNKMSWKDATLAFRSNPKNKLLEECISGTYSIVQNILFEAGYSDEEISLILEYQEEKTPVEIIESSRLYSIGHKNLLSEIASGDFFKTM